MIEEVTLSENVCFLKTERVFDKAIHETIEG